MDEAVGDAADGWCAQHAAAGACVLQETAFVPERFGASALHNFSRVMSMCASSKVLSS